MVSEQIRTLDDGSEENAGSGRGIQRGEPWVGGEVQGEEKGGKGPNQRALDWLADQQKTNQEKSRRGREDYKRVVGQSYAGAEVARVGGRRKPGFSGTAEHRDHRSFHKKKQAHRPKRLDGETALVHERNQDKIQRNQYRHGIGCGDQYRHLCSAP